MFTPEVKYVFKHRGIQTEQEVSFVNLTGQRCLQSTIMNGNNVLDYMKTGLPYSVIEPVLVDSLIVNEIDGNIVNETLLFHLPDVDKYVFGEYQVWIDGTDLYPSLYIYFDSPTLP